MPRRWPSPPPTAWCSTTIPDERYGPKRVYTSHRPSILQDYDLGRPMEIELIVRAPVAFARSAGVDTPTLDAIESICVALAHAKGLYAP